MPFQGDDDLCVLLLAECNTRTRLWARNPDQKDEDIRVNAEDSGRVGKKEKKRKKKK